MPKKSSGKSNSKTRQVLHEFKAGTLHSGKGKNAPVVKSRKQAIAIALNSGRKSGRKR